jgi:hypothetical protein
VAEFDKILLMRGGVRWRTRGERYMLGQRVDELDQEIVNGP